MNRTARFSLVALLCSAPFAGCGGEDAEAPLGEQTLAGTKTQGTKTQGTKTQGTILSEFLYVGYAGGTKGGRAVTGLKINKGQLEGTQKIGSVSHALTGTGLTNVYLKAMNPDNPNYPQDLWITRVSSVVGGMGDQRGADPSRSTRLYDVKVRVGATWQPLCEQAPDDGASWAVPVAAIWNRLGDRIETTTHFSFACAVGVIAKCYAWGYRPWISAEHRDAHQACTRAARADYCGDGVPHTVPGTTINVWDELVPRAQENTPRPDLGLLFEAGWTTRGARCLSHYRWLSLPIAAPTELCPTPGRQTPYPDPGVTVAAGVNCPAGQYLGPGGFCIPAFTGHQGPAGWVCDDCATARAIAKGLPMSLPVYECDDSANNGL